MILVGKNELIKLAPMHWSNRLCTGFPVVDKHHKKLFALTASLNRLIYAPYTDERRTSIEQIALALRNYTIYHFSAEESIFQRNGYEFYAEHKLEHETFVQTVEQVFPQLINGDLKAQEEIYEFLSNWLIQHISESDKRWTDWIAEHSVIENQIFERTL